MRPQNSTTRSEAALSAQGRSGGTRTESPARCWGGQIRTTPSYVGTAVEYAKLMVRRRGGRGRAGSARARGPGRGAPGRAIRSAWTCPRCGSDVDAGFDVCWNLRKGLRCSAGCDDDRGTKDRSGTHGDDKARRLFRGAICRSGVRLPLLTYTIPLVLGIDKSKLSPRGLRHTGSPSSCWPRRFSCNGRSSRRSSSPPHF